MSDLRRMDEAGPQEVLDLVAYAFQWELSEKNKERYRLLAENSWNKLSDGRNRFCCVISRISKSGKNRPHHAPHLGRLL